MSAFQQRTNRRGLLARMRAAAANRRGVAILMVIAVLAALVALASPFVMSMVLHGRQARNELTSLQARSGAEASISHATAQLYKTALRPDPQSLDPYVTTPADLRVTMDFPAAAIQMEQMGVNVQNTSGILWSAKVEDEQGKINITTAHPALLGNLMGSAILTENANRGATQLIVDDASHLRKTGGLLYLNGEPDAVRYTAISGNAIQLATGLTESHLEGALAYDGRALVILDAKYRGRDGAFVPPRSIYEMKEALGTRDSIGPDEFARWERHITVQSGMNTPLWGHGEPQPGNTSDVAVSFDQVTVAKGDGFTPGGMVRSVVDGVPTSFSRIGLINLRNDGSATIRAYPNLTVPGRQPGRSNLQTFVVFQPQFQHPININTATTEVLEAVFTGVCIYGSKEAITREKAQLLADLMREGGRTFATKDQLRKAFDEAHNRGLLTIAQRDAVFINATEANSPRLRTSTVPFTFHTYGHLTIEGSGVVNSDNGIQLSRNTQRQLISLPTPWPGHFHVAFQRQFQELLDKGLGSRVVTFPTPMPSQRLRRAANNVKLGMEHSGGARLDVGASGILGYGPNYEWYEPCDDPNLNEYRQDGYDMSKRGPFDLATSRNMAGGAGSGGGGGPGGRNPGNLIRYGASGNNNNNNNNNRNNPTRGAENEYLPIVKPGGVELWYKPLGGGQCVFYDESTEDDRNRITFSYDPSKGLMLEILDSGLETSNPQVNGWRALQRKPFSVVYPVQLTSGDWHHVAASWKHGSYNGAEIRYDAQPIPPGNAEIIQYPATKLSSDLSATENMSLDLDDAPDDAFPIAGAVKIGEEIIEYKVKQGNKLTQLRRGARYSSAVPHFSGEMVLPYGFTVELRQNFEPGNGLLAEALGRENTQGETATRIEMPPGAMPPYYTEGETKIRVADATSFPPSGFIHCSGELIFYKKKTATTLEGLQRNMSCNGQTGIAKQLNNGAGIQLVSFIATSDRGYDRPRPPGGGGTVEQDGREYVQIDSETDEREVEWLEYGDIQRIDGKIYFIARMVRDVQNNVVFMRHDGQFRSAFGIGRNQSHSKKAKIIPVVEVDGPQCGDRNSPFGEMGVSQLTLIDNGTSNGEMLYVKMAHSQMWRHTVPITDRQLGWNISHYVGFNDFVSRMYSRGTSRLVKWPSGELPDTSQAKRIVGADRNGQGQIRGHVDELKAYQPNRNGMPVYSARLAIYVGAGTVTADATELVVEDYTAWPRNKDNTIRDGPATPITTRLNNWPKSGLLRLGEEIAFYDDWTLEIVDIYVSEEALPANKQARMGRDGRGPPFEFPNIQRREVLRLKNVKRGVLDSKAEQLSPGTQVMLYDTMAVTTLRSLSRDSLILEHGAGFPVEGYVWVNNEVISYTGGGDTRGASGGTKVNATLTGIANFRARFGTREDMHAAGDVVRFLPFRYWDRNPIYEDGEGVAFIQGGYFAQDAVFDSIQIETKGTEEYPKPNAVRPRIIARFNGKPSWGNEPTNKDGGLWEFKNKEGTIPIRTDYGRGVRADQAEVRVYWEYKTGAFIPNSDWKRTFQIEKLGANYKTPLVLRRLDEIERR